MSESNPAGAVVPDLIRLREQLTAWIAKLDEVGPQASSRVAERVRADYADRLRRVNEDLAAHRGEIEADLARFRAALAEAEELRARAADELDELSLRHLIGELDEAQWDEARPALERRVSDAGDAVARARDEVEHLQRLADDIAGSAAAVEAAAAEPEAPPAEEAPPPLPGYDEPAAPVPDAPAFGGTAAEAEAGAPAAEAEPQPPMFGGGEAIEPEPTAEPESAPAEEAPPADPRVAAEGASVDEWDPFGGEFAAEPKQGDAEEDLPWLEGIDEAARGWSPPAADEGLDFLREIEESTRGGASGGAAQPPAGDLGADDLAFLEELDRAIGSAPASGGARAPTPPPPTPPPGAPAPAGAGGSRAEPLLCKECGAINEPHSWYCEICGSEL